MDKILISHGSGGELSHNLINDIIYENLGNEILLQKTDSALLNLKSGEIAFTTDSYVVDPIFFPGGDIGKLAVSGTVNDLAVSGAEPLYLSLSLILEEGLETEALERIIISVAETAKRAGVKIVTGDTKVVPRGKCDKIFINTAGVGVFNESGKETSTGENISHNDSIIINGFIADHGISILKARENIDIQPEIKSDCAPLNSMVAELIKNNINIKFMRDATRGGLATVLCETVSQDTGIEIEEDKIPVRENVNGLCELFGFDPLYLANEGKIVFIIDSQDTEKALKIMKKHTYGKDSVKIGTVTQEHPGKVIMKTTIGGSRIIEMLAGEQLPRIC